MKKYLDTINKGVKYYNKKDYQKAIKIYKSIPKKIVDLFPDDVKCTYYFNLSIAYLSLGNYKNARKYAELSCKYPNGFELCKDIFPICSFGEGDLVNGFKGYKYRYYHPNPGPGNFPRHNFIMSYEQFKTMKDKNILVNDEQGFGDDMMFSLSFKYLSENVKSATVIIRKPLKKLFDAIYHFDNIKFISEYPEEGDEGFDDFFNQFDYWTVTGDIFTYEFLETGKWSGLQEPEVVQEKVRNAVSDTYIEPDIKTPAIGIVCYTLPSGSNADLRSISWRHFKKFTENQNLYLVQKLMPEHDKYNKNSNIPCIIGDNFDFLDTAKILLKMDKIYSADTSVTHLAGLLGLDLTIVINKHFDWRWKYAKLYHQDKVKIIQLKELENLKEL